MTLGEQQTVDYKAERVPDVACHECQRVIVGGAYVWYGKVFCAKCGEFYSHWPEKGKEESTEQN